MMTAASSYTAHAGAAAFLALTACAAPIDQKVEPIAPLAPPAPDPDPASAALELELTANALREPSLAAAAQWIERARDAPAERDASLRIARKLLKRVTGAEPTRLTRALDKAAGLGGTPFVITGESAPIPRVPTLTKIGVFTETRNGFRLYSATAPTVSDLGPIADVMALPSGEVRTLAEDKARDRWRVASEPDGKVLVDVQATTVTADDVAGLLAAHRFIYDDGSMTATLDVFDLATGASKAHWHDVPLSVAGQPRMVFDRNGKRVAVTVESGVSVGDLATRKWERQSVPEAHPPTLAWPLAFTEDGKSLCFVHLGVASLFRDRSRPAHCAFDATTAHHSDAVPLRPSPDGAWKTATGLGGVGMQHHELGAAAFSRSRKLGAVFEVEGAGTKRYRVRVFDVATGKTVSTATPESSPVDVALRFSNDGSVIGWGSRGSPPIQAFDVATGKEVPFPEERPTCAPALESTVCVVPEPRSFCAFGELFAPAEVCPDEGG